MQDSNSSVWSSPSAQQLAKVVSDITDVQTMQNFLRDVMTEKEIVEISSRLEAARMLKNGQKYTDITAKTRLSSRTIARISDWMQQGCGGYQSALAIVELHHGHISPARAD